MSKCDCNDNGKIRIVSGNDLTVEALVSIYDEGKGYYASFDLTGASDVKMRIVGAYSKVEGENVTVSGSKVKAFFKAGRYGAGNYGVEITFTRGQESFRVFERGLFSVVRDSGEASLGTSAEGGSGEGMNISVDVRSRTLRVGQVSGITDYNLLENRPSIGGVTLEGNKRPSDLGMYSKEEADGKFETKSHAADTFQTKESAAEADKRIQGMLDGKVDKIPGKGLSANDLTDERAGKVDKLKTDGRANEYLNGAGTYSRPVRQGYGVSVADDNTVSVDPQVIARQSDVANVAADLAAQKAKEQGDIDRANAAISKEETDRKAAVAALQSLIDILNSDSNVDGSVKKTVADAIARVVAGAPEDLDTLKEIADYIASDKTGAAQLAAAISQLQTLTEKHTSDIAGNASGVAENKAGVAALKTLTAGHTKSIEDLGIAKQDALVSGTNIKTINGVPVLGSGDIKTPAPTKVSELENDKGFLTEHQSLEAYYQKAAAQLDNRVVAEAIVSLAARLDALEGSRGILGDATAGTVDVRGLTRCRYPLVMLGHGVPAEANVPVNLPDGLPWDGVPVFIGQLYINLDTTSGGLYYATGHNSVADWKQG